MAAPGNLSSSPRYCKLPIERPGLALADAGRLKECKGMADADSKYCLEALELNPIPNPCWVDGLQPAIFRGCILEIMHVAQVFS